jgi:hypothetical protein
MNGPLLAANYSHALEVLLDRCAGMVDAVKVSEFGRARYEAAYRKLAARKPLILHGIGQVLIPSSPSFEAEFDAGALQRALQFTQSKHVSVHLERLAGQGEEFTPETYLGLVSEHVDLIRAAGGLPVLLENIPYYRSRTGNAVNDPLTCDPGFIREALSRTGCGLLLDIAHAQVAAWHRGEPPLDYVRSLPLGAVREVHINGPVMVAGELRDRHGETTQEGYALLGEVLAVHRPAYVTLEYGGIGPALAGWSDAVVLERQLPRLRGMLDCVGGHAESQPQQRSRTTPRSDTSAS